MDAIVFLISGLYSLSHVSWMLPFSPYWEVREGERDKEIEKYCLSLCVCVCVCNQNNGQLGIFIHDPKHDGMLIA